MFRSFKPIPSDFRQFIDLFYRTDFSYQINQPSEKYKVALTAVNSSPNFSLYCSMIASNIYCYRAFTDKFGKVVAGIAYSINCNGVCSITGFFVSRQHQLKGIGREFYNQFENYLKSLLVHQIILISFSAGSVEFWKKMGFEDFDSDTYLKVI